MVGPNQDTDKFDNYFRDLVQEATCKTCVSMGNTDGELVLNKPFEYTKDDDVLQTINSIDCDTGLLMCKTKYIRYTDLKLYDIKRLHAYVVQLKRYKFVPNTINNR